MVVKHTTRTVQEHLGQLMAVYFQLLEIKKLFELLFVSKLRLQRDGNLFNVWK